jgi:hypothetical protein
VVGGAAAEAGGVGYWRRPWIKDEICFLSRDSHGEFGEICFFFFLERFTRGKETGTACGHSL